MHTEIERKFIVTDSTFKQSAVRIMEIQEFLGGDYIIKGVNGEFYPCKPDIFEKTYEEVAE